MDIVEKVARAIDEASDYRPAYPDEWRKCAHAAIRATLQHYIENVSEGMAEACYRADPDLAYSRPKGAPQDIISAVLSQALKELDARKGE